MNLTRALNVLVIISVIFVLGNTGIAIVPWYMQENPMLIVDPAGERIKNAQFNPGDSMHILFKRKALIGFSGKVIRELVRINPHTSATEEIWKSAVDTSVGRGTKTIILTYNIPTLGMYPEMKYNTYKWQGCMTYRPFGLVERTFFFETEQFKIRIKGEAPK